MRMCFSSSARIVENLRYDLNRIFETVRLNLRKFRHHDIWTISLDHVG